MTQHNDASAAFGAYLLSPWRRFLREFGCTLPEFSGARRVASLIRRLTIVGRRDPFDVAPFPGQRARLYPRDNLCEKRVFSAPQLWDARERRALAGAINEARPDRAFIFVDAGANVGLYSLFARSAATRFDRAFKGVAIEPDPENIRRLRFNAAMSGTDELTVVEAALSAKGGFSYLTGGDGNNRGEIALGVQGEPVRTMSLPSALNEAGCARVDALKIDIEGAEFDVLSDYFGSAHEEMWPSMIIMEAPLRSDGNANAVDLCVNNGYEIIERTRLNAILVRKKA